MSGHVNVPLPVASEVTDLNRSLNYKILILYHQISVLLSPLIKIPSLAVETMAESYKWSTCNE